MVKIRHPDYEVYRTGVHAYRDIACADCHMPYRTEGGVKFTDHHLQSPLLNIANSCAVCHRWSEEEIRSRVEGIQDKVQKAATAGGSHAAQAHFDIAAAMQAGATDDELAGVRKLVRHAQLRWDYVAANNGMGFHSPQECERILAAAIDLAGQCRVECAGILGQTRRDQAGRLSRLQHEREGPGDQPPIRRRLATEVALSGWPNERIFCDGARLTPSPKSTPADAQSGRPASRIGGRRCRRTSNWRP